MIPLTEEVEAVAVLCLAEPARPRVLYEDGEILVVDKGPHEPTMPQGEYAGSLLARTRRIPGAEEAVPIEPMEVRASGLVVFARSARYVEPWTRVLERASRAYVAAVRGVCARKGSITRRLRRNGASLEMTTRFRRLAVASHHTLLQVTPDGGPTQCIRRHLAAIRHPVLGDDRYGDPATNRHLVEKYALDRAFLHCSRIELDPPRGTRLVVESPLPGDLRAVLERLAGRETLRLLDQEGALGAV